MDDSADVDLVDLPPISSPDHFQIAPKQIWRTGEPHSDAERDANYHRGSPQRLPHPSQGCRRLEPLTLDTNLPPPFLYSPDYPSTVESTPLSSSHTPGYFDFCGESLLPAAKVHDGVRFRHYPHLPAHDSEDFDDAYAWDLRSRFSPFWDSGDDSDASEPSDDSTDYITFSGRSASILPELELPIRQFDLSEPSPFALDFPEDVDESLEHDTTLEDGDLGEIDRLRRPSPVPASEIPVELSVQTHEGSPTLSVCALDILLPRMRRLSEDGPELESLPRPELDVTGAPINVPLSPFITGGFLDDTTPIYSNLAGGEVEEISVDADWLGGPWREMFWSACLEDGLS